MGAIITISNNAIPGGCGEESQYIHEHSPNRKDRMGSKCKPRTNTVFTALIKRVSFALEMPVDVTVVALPHQCNPWEICYLVVSLFWVMCMCNGIAGPTSI